jgi:hypothetical protein
MTDKEKLVALFTEFGIEHGNDRKDIVLDEGARKVTGYSSFYARFEFDEDGKFQQVGVWE